MKPAIITIVIIVAVLFVGWVLWPNTLTIPIGDERNSPRDTNEDTNAQTPRYPRTINALHQYENDKHIVAGAIDLPTPCHVLSHEVVITESFPEQVTIQFTSATQAEACAQVITAARYKVEFAASEQATVHATFNGEAVNITLEERDDLEDFDIFLKG